MDKRKFRVLLTVGALVATALVIKLGKLYQPNQITSIEDHSQIENHSQIKDTTNYEYQKAKAHTNNLHAK